MKRRELMKTSAVLAGSLWAAGSAQASTHSNSEHPHQALIDSLANCIARGEICLNHCDQLLAKGETNMAECHAAVTEMLILCKSMMTLSSRKSSLAKDLAALCKTACVTCEKACEKHAKHHISCRDCMRACKSCLAELKKAFA